MGARPLCTMTRASETLVASKEREKARRERQCKRGVSHLVVSFPQGDSSTPCVILYILGTPVVINVESPDSRA